MPQRAADQITLVDLTDGVSVVMSSESYNFPGTTTNAIAGSTTTKIQAIMGGEYVAASVNVAAITKPTGITVASDGHATAPTLTISIAASVTVGGEVVIPVVVDGLTIEKRFSYAIAYRGNTGNTGATGNTGPTGPAGAAATIMGLENESHTVVTNAAGAASAAVTIPVDFYAFLGSTRTPVTAVVGTLPSGMTVGTNTPGTASADGVLTLVVANGATLGNVDSGVVPITLTAGSVSRVQMFSWSKAKQGVQGSTGATGGTGAAGEPAIVLEVSSSQGLVFKNTQVATVLTARVYRGGVELTGTAINPYGTIRWYKDGSTTPLGTTGATLTVSAGDVQDRATYEAKLEY